MTKMKLYGEPGWGSVLVEAQLAWYGVAFDFEATGDLFAASSERENPSACDNLKKANPLAQIPTLVLPSGEVMTESAAITLWLADLTGSDDLVPRAEEEGRKRFLRWLIFITSNIYPTYTYADDPARFVPDEGAQKGFADKVFAYGERLYAILGEEARGPWFLGERFSAIDIYIGALSRWRPGPEWFEAKAPKLAAIGARARELPRLAEVWSRNFPS